MLSSFERSLFKSKSWEFITPILAMEVLSDLSKGSKKSDDVQILAGKFRGGVICSSYQNLLLNSLTGNHPPMDGRVPLDYGERVRSEDGALGMVVNPHPINWDIIRWAQGTFEPEERRIAEEWRRITTEVSFSPFEKQLSKRRIILSKVRNDREAVLAAEALLSKLSLQLEWIEMLLEHCNVDRDIERAIHRRWNNCEKPWLKNFAPYAYYCLRSILIVQIMYRHKLLNFQATHDLDLQYLFYLPFSMVFISNDKFHRRLVPLIKRGNQSFVSGEDLKEDLKTILSKTSKVQLDRGLYNLELPAESLMAQLHRRHMRPIITSHEV